MANKKAINFNSWLKAHCDYNLQMMSYQIQAFKFTVQSISFYSALQILTKLRTNLTEILNKYLM